MIVGGLFFLIIGVLFVFFPIMIGIYVYRDANRRGMNAVLWTLIAVLAPSLIGLIIYLIVRTDHSALQCPNCKGSVTEQYTVCPQCGTPLKHKCVKCDHALEAAWQICPNCGEPVPEDLKVPLVNVQKDKGLGKILLAVILIPLLIISLLIVGLVAFRSNLTTTPDPISVIDPLLMKNDAAYLFDAKIDYLGDNSGVSRLIKETGLAQVGQYTIELMTDREPYGIRIIFTSSTKEFGLIDFSSNAIELLGLIKNLDVVEITDGAQTYKLTKQEASETLGFDVKELGRSYDKLEEYYNSLND